MLVWIAPMLVAYAAYTCFEQRLSRTLELTQDGVHVLPGANPEMALALLPEGYRLLDYRYTIRGCALSTFHRDVTSSPYEFDTEHPVFTLIVYHSPGKLLSVVPGSHSTVPFVWGRPRVIEGGCGTGVMFHCDVLHAGVMSRDPERHAVQYKLVHEDDLSHLQGLQGIDQETKSQTAISRPYEYLSRKISLLFPCFFNHVMTRFLQYHDGSRLNRLLLALFGRAFYNR